MDIFSYISIFLYFAINTLEGNAQHNHRSRSGIAQHHHRSRSRNVQHYQQSRPSSRPGKCPNNPATCYPITRYHKRCHDDYDCPSDHKCCSDVGGHMICLKVQNIRKYPGCPTPSKVSCIIDNGRPDIRHTDCTRDRDCARDFKCCSDEFGHRICVREEKHVKPGVCRKYKKRRNCGKDRCRKGYDQDCRRNKKCCFDGCRYRCLSPRRLNYRRG